MVFYTRCGRRRPQHRHTAPGPLPPASIGNSGAAYPLVWTGKRRLFPLLLPLSPVRRVGPAPGLSGGRLAAGFPPPALLCFPWRSPLTCLSFPRAPQAILPQPVLLPNFPSGLPPRQALPPFHRFLGQWATKFPLGLLPLPPEPEVHCHPAAPADRPVQLVSAAAPAGSGRCCRPGCPPWSSDSSSGRKYPLDAQC